MSNMTLNNSKWGDPKTWPKQIKDRRNEHALSHEDLAADSGISTRRIVKLEKGHKSCTELEYETVLKTLDSYNVEPTGKDFLDAVSKQSKRTELYVAVGIPSKRPLTAKEALGVTDEELNQLDERVDIALQIRNTRKQKGVSDEKFAEALGSGVDQVGYLEHAHHSCTTQDLQSALDILKWF